MDELELDFVELNKNDSAIRRNLNEMREFEFVLQRVEQFFEVVSALLLSFSFFKFFFQFQCYFRDILQFCERSDFSTWKMKP